jgi:hypothetical protein
MDDILNDKDIALPSSPFLELTRAARKIDVLLIAETPSYNGTGILQNHLAANDIPTVSTSLEGP